MAVSKFIMKPQFTIGAFAIIFDEQGRVLLCHRTDHDLWNLPGGTVEETESPVVTVKREVKEETGFDVEIVRPVGVYSKNYKNDIVFAFVCKIVSGKTTANFEADKIEYFAPSKLPLNTLPHHVERIEDALKNSNEVFFRVQTGKSAVEMLKEGKL